ncbi:MAG: hypothetical protein GC181_08935 [Bacteroidetes bacterium]|nr:hypothetical protein [Bacteroidota bacterium]
MKHKLLNLALILTSLLGYLEWGEDQHQFLFQTEGLILSKLFTSPKEVIHPFVLIPLFGQLILLITLFQKNPSKWLTYLGMFSLAVLLGFMLFIGLLGFNAKIILSTLPFVTTCVLFSVLKPLRKIEL